MSERIAIFGAGAVGAYVGGYLTHAGRDVTLIDPWKVHVEKMNTEGLVLSGLTEPENFTVKPRAILVDDLKGGAPFDIIFICTKSFNTENAAKTMKPYIAEPNGFMVSLQNSINEPTIASVVGEARTIGCIASQISVSMWEPGAVRRNVALGGDKHVVFRVGELDGRVTDRVKHVSEILSDIDSSKVTETLMGERWSKLCVNCMRNPVSGASGLATNDCDRNDHIRGLAIRIAAEAVAVATAEGHPLEKISGISPELLLRAGQGDADAFKQCEDIMIAGIARRSDAQRPSMAQDIGKGMRTEIDYINGTVVEAGKKHGIPTPANAAIVFAVKKVEAKEAEPSPDLVMGI
ncbi:MAG: 2-dehydropantoate 2-reductase [Rhodospirillaceae bacterium]